MGFQITAIIILLTFYACYFVKMILQKKKGIQTDQIGKGKVGIVRRIELTMKAATLMVPIAELASIYFNTTIFTTWARYAGIGIAVFGDVIFVISVLTMKDSWRAGVPETNFSS